MGLKLLLANIMTVVIILIVVTPQASVGKVIGTPLKTTIKQEVHILARKLEMSENLNNFEVGNVTVTKCTDTCSPIKIDCCLENYCNKKYECVSSGIRTKN